MTVDDIISWETKLDLGYRDMGAAYSHGGKLEARYVLGPNVALSGNYSLARAYLRTIPIGVDVNGVSTPRIPAPTASWLESCTPTRATWPVMSSRMSTSGCP